MVTQTLNDEVMAELAEAAANGLNAEDLVEVEQAIDAGGTPLGPEQVRLKSGEVAQQGFTYLVGPSDAAQWIAAWRMEVGRDGLEYGRPTKLNKSQLGLHLSRRRSSDGGRLFVIAMPKRVVPAGRFQCFAVPDQCWKKLSSKGMLLDHIENFHPTAARHFHEELEIIRKGMNKDNAALQATITQLAEMSDDPWVAVPEEVRAVSAEDVAEIDVTAGTEAPDPLSIVGRRCHLCPWPDGSAKWAGRIPPQKALRMHVIAMHKAETE